MFDFLRNLTKTADEKQQELLSAYLDDALSSRQRQHFERQLAQDTRLQEMLAQQRLLKTQLRQLPPRRVPRNFTLDPALYGRPQREPLLQFYPALRLATVLTAFFFILTVGMGIFGGLTRQSMAPAAADVALMVEESAAEAEAPAPQVVEVTRVVTEEVVEEAESVVTEMVVEEAEEVVVEVEQEVAVESAAPQAEGETAEMEAPAEPAAEPAAAEAAVEVVTAEASIDVPAEDLGGSVADAANTPTPMPTSQAALAAPTATAKTALVPRATLPTDAEDSDRAVAGFQATAAAADDTAQIAAAPTVVAATPVTAPTTAAPAFGGLPFIQLGLGVVFIALAALTLIARRRFR